MTAKLRTIAYGMGCFLLPVGILIVAAAVCGLHPLGSNLFMLNDMNAQYVDFFAWYRDVLTGSADATYSTTQALGQNMMGTISYYLASPLNILVLFFDERDISVAFFAITLVKVGCAELSMVFYLRRRFALSRTWACALALGFSLSLWTLMQVRNIMWMDALILLPLCAWGVCCLLRTGRWHLLTISTAVTVITCWYTAYMVILFLCLYVLFEGYALGTEGVRTWGPTHRKRLLQFAGCMAVALALAAFLFLPTILSMTGAGAASDSDSLIAYLQKMLDKHLPMLGMSASHILLICGGALALISACVLIAFRRFSLRRRLAGILCGMLALLSVAALIVPSLQQESLGAVGLALFGGAWTGQLYANDFVPQLFASTLVVALCIVFFASKRIPLKLKLACALFLALLIASTWLRLLMIIWGGMRLPHGYHNRMAFLAVFMLIWVAAYGVQHALLPWASHATDPAGERNGKDKPNIRVLLAKTIEARWFAGAILMLTIAELTVRSCLVWGSLYQEGEMGYVNDYYDSALVQAAELEEHDPGIYRVEKSYQRYNSLGFNEGMTYGFDQLSSYSSTNDHTVLAFLSAMGYGNGAYFTNDIYPTLVLDSLLGVKYLSAFDAPEHYADAGLSPTRYPDGARFWENPYALPLAYGASTDVLSYQVPDENDATSRWERLNTFANAIWGQSASLYGAESPDADPVLDMSTFTRMIDDLKAHPFAFDRFGGSHISGAIDATEGQVLLMTIPNQDGWSITVNGTHVQSQDVANGALMAIPVQPGLNQVEMTFTAPGLIPGAALTLAALLFVLLAPRIRRIRRVM